MVEHTSVRTRSIELRKSLLGAVAISCIATVTVGITTTAQAAMQPPRITAGNSHSCALISGGTVKCWGYNGNGQLGDGTTTDRSVSVSVTGITAATQITAGYSH